MLDEFWNGKRVLVTGADGFMGSHLVEELLRRQAKVIAFTRSTSTHGTSQIKLKHLGPVQKQLERVNQRVALIARYAPRQLHEMRDARAKAAGEEGFGEFNPVNAIDWRERMDDIDLAMLMGALHRAATEHIEGEGWRPLLTGGLETLRLLATTAALANTFPTLADAGNVARWVEFVESRLDAIELAPDDEIL